MGWENQTTKSPEGLFVVFLIRREFTLATE